MKFLKDDEDRLLYICLAIVLFFIILLCTGCRSKMTYVPIESTKTEYVDRMIRDSIYKLDSVFLDRYQKGDTIFITKEKFVYLYKDKFIHDSIFICDTIKVPYPVETIKETNNLTKIQQGLIGIGIGAICIGIFFGYRKIKGII